jgi:uncharacterized protein YdeI (YjbR/CyaY-like superfamily)
MGEDREAIYFDGPAAWRSWLEENHATEREVWVGYWKKSSGRAVLTWSEAVDQALCFGWIDGVRQSVDDDRSRQRFTPRRARSSWSRINVAKVSALEEQGLMTPAGRAAFEARVPEREGVYAYENDAVELPPAYAAQLAASPRAQAYFEAQRPSYRKIARQWVMSAKRESTRDRRMAELVADCEAGRLIRPQRYGADAG